MTIDQIKTFAMDAVLQHPPREVYVAALNGETHMGTLTYAGQNKFRVDKPLAACFFTYDEVEAIEYASDQA